MEDDTYTTYVELEPGTPVRGVWCPHCLLPSALTFPISLLGPGGLTPCGEVTVCHDCSAQW